MYDGTTLSPLLGEHNRLGAEFHENGVVRRYATRPAAEDVPGLTVLSDLTHLPLLLISGNGAPGYVGCACAGPVPQVTECSYEAVLTGDGSLIAVPLVMRTGEAEYLVVDASERAEILLDWLSFLSGIEEGGVRPFSDVSFEDVGGSHILLYLAGPAATVVLEDYLGGEGAPVAGTIRQCTLDWIPCICCSLPTRRDARYLLFVPPVHAPLLWQSLLSFTEVTPIGRDDMEVLLARDHPLWDNLVTTDLLRIPRHTLKDAGVLRDGEDFVGARGLKESMGGADA